VATVDVEMCVAVYVLQCVAVCRSVLQCFTQYTHAQRWVAMVDVDLILHKHQYPIRHPARTTQNYYQLLQGIIVCVCVCVTEREKERE